MRIAEIEEIWDKYKSSNVVLAYLHEPTDMIDPNLVAALKFLLDRLGASYTDEAVSEAMTALEETLKDTPASWSIVDFGMEDFQHYASLSKLVKNLSSDGSGINCLTPNKRADPVMVIWGGTNV